MGSTFTCRVADYLMSRLTQMGVCNVFFLPGGGAMHLNDALACENGLTAIACHHEQACGISAEANGRTSNAGFGVALVTTGPGATNVITPIAGAWIESLPLLVISGQVKRSDSMRGRTLRQGGVQEVDIVSIVEHITKYAITVQDPEDIRSNFEEAIWNMRNGRAGPVLLDIPLDVQAAPIDPLTLVGFQHELDSVGPQNLSQEISKLQSILVDAKRPLILAGHGVRIAGGEILLRQVAEKLGIPCIFTWNAADILPWEHPLYIGRPGVVAARAPNFAVQNCDCLISLGCRLDNVITAYNPKGFAREAKKIVVDIDVNELVRHDMDIDLKVCADARAFLGAWANLNMQGSHWQAWRETCSNWKRQYTPLDGRVFSEEGPISHFQLADALSDAIPENQLVITGSSGLAIEVFYTAFKNKVGQRIFLTSGLGSMGYGLPAAIGACIGAGSAPTVCIESDGSLMLNLQELATLKALDLPIVLVIMNNNGYASIRNTQRNYFEGRYIGTGPQSGLHIPDFIEIGKAMGFSTYRISNFSELSSDLANIMEKRGPIICEILLKEEEALMPKVAAIPQQDGSMISMPLEDMSPLLSIEQLQNEMIVDLDERSRLVKR